MGEIGSGNNSSYPGALDTNAIPEVNSPAAGKTKARKEVVEDLTDGLIKVETELGTDPAGSLTDVKTFLQTHHQTDGTHKSTHGPHKWLDEQDYANFTAAVAAAANKTLVVARSINLDANTTIPASVSLMPINPGIINANGYTLTINGSVVGNPMHQWLSGFATGEVTFVALKPNSKIEAVWFGYTGDGTTDDRVAGQIAIDATPNHCILNFHGRGHMSYTTITLDHSAAGAGASVNYNGVWKIIGREGLKIRGNFTRATTSTSWYWLFICQNSQDITFRAEYEGYYSLDADNDGDSDLLNSGELDQKDGVVVLVSDRCKRIHADIKVRKAHGAMFIYPYDNGASDYFDAQHRPYNISAVISAEDTTYGFCNFGADNTCAMVNGINMKRAYRCHGGNNHILNVNHTTKDNNSWGASEVVLIRPTEPSGTLKTVNGRVNISGASRIVLVGVAANSSSISGVDITLEMAEGRLLVYNSLGASGSASMYDITFKGSLWSTQAKPVEIKGHADYDNDTGSKIKRLRFTDFNLYSNVAAVQELFMFSRRTGDSVKYYQDVTFNNVYVEANVADVDTGADGYYDGALVFQRIDGLIVNNLRHVLTGTYTTISAGNSIVFDKCNNISHRGISTVSDIAYLNSTTDYYGINGKNSSSSLMTLDIDTEQTVETIGTFTASDKFKVWINGVEYYIQLDAV